MAALDKRIAGETATPPQVAWFPGEGLEAESVRLVPESVLGIRALRRGYVGVYDAGKAFVVTEETAEAATATLAKVKQRFDGRRGDEPRGRGLHGQGQLPG